MNIKNLEYKTITPAYAKQLLEKNYENNRRMRAATVAQYARDMEAGKWVTNAYENQIDPVCISKSGKVLNGQHRLAAIVRSDKAIKLFIQTELDEDAYKVMDNGIKRTTADILGSAKNSKHIATLLKYVVATKYGDAPLLSCLKGKVANAKDVFVTRQDIIEEYEGKNSELYDYCACAGVSMRGAIGKGGAGTYAYFIWLCKWLGRDEALEEFVNDMSSSKAAKCINVELVKRTILQSYVKTSRGNGVSPADLLATLLRGYEATLAGIELDRISHTKNTVSFYSGLVDRKRENRTMRGEQK